MELDKRVAWLAVGICVLLTIGFGVLAATVAPGAINAAAGTAMAAIITALIVGGCQVYDALTETEDQS